MTEHTRRWAWMAGMGWDTCRVGFCSAGPNATNVNADKTTAAVRFERDRWRSRCEVMLCYGCVSQHGRTHSCSSISVHAVLFLYYAWSACRSMNMCEYFSVGKAHVFSENEHANTRNGMLANDVEILVYAMWNDLTLYYVYSIVEEA